MRYFTDTDSGAKMGESAFEALLRPQLTYLYRISYRFTGNNADAEDLVQDLLVKLYPRRKELNMVANLRPWLVRVLYRLFLDQKRRMNRSPLRLVKKRRDDDAIDPLDEIPGTEPDPEQYTRGRMLSERIESALDRLEKDQRAVVVLHDVEGYLLNELESLLEVPLGTLKSRLHRARAKLRKILEKDGTFSPVFPSKSHRHEQ